MNDEIKFEDLSSVEQENKLREVMKQIKILQRAEVISGDVDIADISFFRLSNGDVAYDVAINNSDNTVGHLYYQEVDNSLSRIDVDAKKDEIEEINNQLALYENSGMDLVPIQNTLMSKEQFLDSLGNPNKISLANLETTRQQCMDLALQLGMDFEEIEHFLTIQGKSELDLSILSPEELQKIEQEIEITGLNKEDALQHIKIDKGEVSLDSSAFDMTGIQSSEIEGNKKVTSNYTFNQIIGANYDSYKILITKSGTPVIVGISQDGSAELLPEDRVEVNRSEKKSMSLMRDDGSIKSVGILVSFKVKDSGSSIGRDQAIGLYSDNGTVNGFYGRNANGDKMIGEELPSTVYSTERVHNERIMDTKYNKDISGEAHSAEQRTDDGCLDDVRNLGNGQSDSMYEQKDSNELAEEYAKKYDIDLDELKKRFEYELEHGHTENTTDENLIKQLAEEIDQEERHEPSLEPGEGHH